MFAFWKKSDDDIPSGHLGQVLADLNEKGKVKVKFPNGSWRFRPKDLVKSHVQPGSYVQWTSSDDDIAVEEIGEATGQRRIIHKNSDLLRMEWSIESIHFEVRIPFLSLVFPTSNWQTSCTGCLKLARSKG
jgi:hypothetical protein